ncbi:50S ribosomal protein L16 3-hydroxylase [Alteromonadaceae bacterium Bs31]|nr:50S ribosomal protein L16 3-hydroxylase [Alteromonadaceae bacterium Bs31]
MNSTHPFAKLTHLGELPVETFLRDYWQKKPLLVRNAFPNFTSAVTPDELAGYAIDDDVVSRLIVEDNGNWQVNHGPIPEAAFQDLPEAHWTLLIQHADLLDPAINQLLDTFRFIPSWRLDDIMISYASDGGGVGPHFDYYDVFLLQAEGNRRWRLGQQCSVESPLLENIDMKVLRNFETKDDFIMKPGDLLYVPPKLAHWGQAQGECITYSIGFRAPSYADVILDFSEESASLATEDMRYSDPALPLQQHSGQISPEALAQVAEILKRYSEKEGHLASWFGGFMTRMNPGGDVASEGDYTTEDYHQGLSCQLSNFARCAFYETSDHCLLFINGAKWHCSKELAIKLSEYKTISIQQLQARDEYIIKHLAEEGLLDKIDE